MTGTPNNRTHHNHTYGQPDFNYYADFLLRVSNDNVAPVTSTPGFASITIGITTIPTDPVYVCPKYNNSYITTGIVEDELAVHPAGPITLTFPDNPSRTYYHNSCLELNKYPLLPSRYAYSDNYDGGIIQKQQLELYAIQDNVTDANQDITLSFEVITDDTTYKSLRVPNVTVTVENASVSAPTAPVNLKATASGANNLITWQKPIMTGLGEGVQSYTLQWNTDNGSSWTNITGITSDNYTHSGLSSSTNYFYQVFANNQGGAGPVSNRDNITTGTLPGITSLCYHCYSS